MDIDTPKAVGNNDVMVQETPEMCTATPVTPVDIALNSNKKAWYKLYL
jgi:hypothetical protein